MPKQHIHTSTIKISEPHGDAVRGAADEVGVSYASVLKVAMTYLKDRLPEWAASLEAAEQLPPGTKVPIPQFEHQLTVSVDEEMQNAFSIFHREYGIPKVALIRFAVAVCPEATLARHRVETLPAKEEIPETEEETEETPNDQ